MKKYNLPAIIFFLFFFLSFAVIHISNYGKISIVLKSAVTILMWLTLAYKIKQDNNNSLKTEIKKIDNKFFRILSYFFLIPFLSIFYSANVEFGTLKFISLVFFGFSFILILKVTLLTSTETDKKIFLYLSCLIILITGLYILIKNPFIQNEIYKFRFGRWSHVVYARFTAPLLLILFLNFFTLNNFKKILLRSIILGLGLYAIYISNMRAAFIGLAGTMPLLLLIKVLKNRVKLKHYAGILISLIFFFIFISLSPANEIIQERYSNMLIKSENDIEKDLSMQSRIIGYTISWEMIKENPVLGVGFGGFRNYQEKKLELNKKYSEIIIPDFTEWLKYSHNIFIEFQVEMGIAGSLLFLFLLFVIFNSVRKYSAELVVIYLFALWFAMLSKDIPSNIFLFTGLVFYGNPYETERIKEFLFPNKKSGVRSGKSSRTSEYL